MCDWNGTRGQETALYRISGGDNQLDCRLASVLPYYLHSDSQKLCLSKVSGNTETEAYRDKSLEISGAQETRTETAKSNQPELRREVHHTIRRI